MIQLKNSNQISAMIEAGRITGEALLVAREHVREGVSTKELDTLIRRHIEKCGAKPSFLGYCGFPGSACISINDEVIHGIPSEKRILREGDIVKIDVGAFYKGFHGDSARTIPVGKVSDEALKLIETTRNSFFCGVDALKVGNRMGDVGYAIQSCVEKEGFSVVMAHNGVDAVNTFAAEKPDLVLLDIMLPQLDGWQVCREIRKTDNTPIIMLTAKDEVFDKVLGLELGADDYVTKPFDTKEIVARIKAVLRRSSQVKESDVKEVRYDKLTVNMTNYQLTVNGEVIETPPKELELIYYLASNPDRVFTRDQLLDDVWGFDYFGDSRTVDVHIKRLRDKLKGVSDEWELRTIWSVGYKFETHGKK